jgi:2-succinyl-5-enolpyruvyl-6-hydroxy-3-cyclohexene-1-carboxylate synthase
VIEARLGRVPLLVLTADRPHELRECGAGQTIDQLRLFGHYPLWQAELALPEPETESLRYLRQSLCHAWDRARMNMGGPVHLNLPFRDPLAPTADEDFDYADLDEPPGATFEDVEPAPLPTYLLAGEERSAILRRLGPYRKGLIVVGPHHPRDPGDHAKKLGQLSEFLGWPVLVDGLGSARNHQKRVGTVISQYDCILRSEDLAGELEPEAILQVGALPTSKILRAWLASVQAPTWVVDGGDENRDPLHGKTVHLRCTLELFFADLRIEGGVSSDYAERWAALENEAVKQINQELNEESGFFEGKVAWTLSRVLPPETPVFVANSMPVRDVEFFWMPSDSASMTLCNRGANGIDGTLSTALGMAQAGNKPAVLLTGDLALLHDGGGPLLTPAFGGSLTIVLVDNGGGGIFHNLPVARFEPPFERLFVTPQSVDFKQLAATHGWGYEKPENWNAFERAVRKLPDKGIRLIHVQCDAKEDVQRRGRLLLETAEGLE